MRAGFLHQCNQFLVETVAAHAVRELQVDVQLALYNPAADRLGAFQIEVEDIVDDHELADAMVAHQPLHLIEHGLCRQRPEFLRVDVVAIGALIRATAFRDELHRPWTLRKMPRRIELEVAVQVEHLVRRTWQRLDVRHGRAAIRPDLPILVKGPNPLYLVRVPPLFDRVKQLGERNLAFTYNHEIHHPGLQALGRIARRMGSAEDDLEPRVGGL